MPVTRIVLFKEDDRVPDRDIDLALTYKNLFILDPETYTYIEREAEPNE